jgi:hypothetical protein
MRFSLPSRSVWSYSEIDTTNKTHVTLSKQSEKKREWLRGQRTKKKGRRPMSTYCPESLVVTTIPRPNHANLSARWHWRDTRSAASCHGRAPVAAVCCCAVRAMRHCRKLLARDTSHATHYHKSVLLVRRRAHVKAPRATVAQTALACHVRRGARETHRGVDCAQLCKLHVPSDAMRPLVNSERKRRREAAVHEQAH